jgi:hypothetical protein
VTTQHLLFYVVETTFITLMLCIGVFVAMHALRRLGMAVRLSWSVPIALWILIACVDVLFSEMIGPEFTLHYYFGLWTFIAACVFWLMTLAHKLALAVRTRHKRATAPTRT